MVMQGCVVVENGRRQLLDCCGGVSVETDLFLLQTVVRAGGEIFNSVHHNTEQEAITCHDLLATVLHQAGEVNMAVH